MTTIDVERFHREGWLGPFRAVDPAEADGLRAHCDALLGDAGESDARVHNPHLRDRRLLDLALRPALVDRVCALLGDDALLWRTHFWNKLPGGREIPWHQDWAYWPVEPAVIVSAWIAIDRSTLANACMKLIPGSHRSPVPHVPAGRDHAFATQADPAGVPRERAVPIELEPGEFALFTERTLHQSDVNASPHRRLGLAVRYIASLSRVLAYDSPEHRLHAVRERPRLAFNRVA